MKSTTSITGQVQKGTRAQEILNEEIFKSVIVGRHRQRDKEVTHKKGDKAIVH